MVAVLGALSLVACSGADRHAASSVVPASGGSAASGTARFTLTIPVRAPSNRGRWATYVSPSTLSATIAVNGGATNELDLGSSVCPASATARTCVISVPAPIGMDSFNLTLYDGPFTAGAHSGTVVGTATAFSALVAEGTANVTVPLVVNGAVTGVQLVVTSEPAGLATSGTSANGSAALDVYDHGGNLIVGGSTYLDVNGNPVTFSIAPSPAYEQISINGGAPAASGTVTSPSDRITFTQTTASIGARLVVTPSTSTVSERQPAYVRPTFGSSAIESAQALSVGSSLAVVPATGNGHGVAITGDAGTSAVTDAGVGIAQSCGSFPPYQANDSAFALGSVWLALGPIYTLYVPTCGYNPQGTSPLTITALPGGSGIADVQTDCSGVTMVSGVMVIVNPSPPLPPSCTNPHDLTGFGDNYAAAVYTNTSDTHDHVGIYLTSYYTNYVADVVMTSGGHTAAGGSLLAIGVGSDRFVVLESTNGTSGYLWNVSRPGSTAASVLSLVPLPSGYTYVVNPHTNVGARSMAIGNDGLAYIAISAPIDGVLVLDPTSGAVVTTLANASAVSGTAPFGVAADERGTIYWTAGRYVMHYPSNIP